MVDNAGLELCKLEGMAKKVPQDSWEGKILADHV